MASSEKKDEIKRLEDRMEKLEKGMDGLVKFINENMAHHPLMFR